MTTSFIITICVLLLIAYVFDITSSKTKIPAVILLLSLGWLVRQISIYYQITIFQLFPLLSILGTIGLVLIVLEGSLELELTKNKLQLIRKTSLISFFSIIFFCVAAAFALQQFEQISFKDALVNVIPFGVISSAIAIPSAQNLSPNNKEFVTYESSLSDIFGVLLFNFFALNETINATSVSIFFIEIMGIIIISFVATLSLAFLLSKIKHHIKYVPIILMIILIYAVSKIFHLPALIFILLFGLFLGNLDEFKKWSIIQKLKPQILNKEVEKFKDLTIEIAFIIRALFFLLFGYLIQKKELLNKETVIWALIITASIFLIRIAFLKVFKLPLMPLLFIAPRGLITILLFLSIPVTQSITFVNKSLVIQVIILTSFIMMIGLMTNKTSNNINDSYVSQN